MTKSTKELIKIEFEATNKTVVIELDIIDKGVGPDIAEALTEQLNRDSRVYRATYLGGADLSFTTVLGLPNAIVDKALRLVRS